MVYNVSDSGDYGASVSPVIFNRPALTLGMNTNTYDFRLTKGIARYRTNFTAPQAPFPTN